MIKKILLYIIIVCSFIQCKDNDSLKGHSLKNEMDPFVEDLRSIEKENETTNKAYSAMSLASRLRVFKHKESAQITINYLEDAIRKNNSLERIRGLIEAAKPVIQSYRKEVELQSKREELIKEMEPIVQLKDDIDGHIQLRDDSKVIDLKIMAQEAIKNIQRAIDDLKNTEDTSLSGIKKWIELAKEKVQAYEKGARVEEAKEYQIKKEELNKKLVSIVGFKEEIDKNSSKDPQVNDKKSQAQSAIDEALYAMRVDDTSLGHMEQLIEKVQLKVNEYCKEVLGKGFGGEIFLNLIAKKASLHQQLDEIKEFKGHLDNIPLEHYPNNLDNLKLNAQKAINQAMDEISALGAIEDISLGIIQNSIENAKTYVGIYKEEVHSQKKGELTKNKSILIEKLHQITQAKEKLRSNDVPIKELERAIEIAQLAIDHLASLDLDKLSLEDIAQHAIDEAQEKIKEAEDKWKAYKENVHSAQLNEKEAQLVIKKAKLEEIVRELQDTNQGEGQLKNRINELAQELSELQKGSKETVAFILKMLQGFFYDSLNTAKFYKELTDKQTHLIKDRLELFKKEIDNYPLSKENSTRLKGATQADVDAIDRLINDNVEAELQKDLTDAIAKIDHLSVLNLIEAGNLTREVSGRCRAYYDKVIEEIKKVQIAREKEIFEAYLDTIVKNFGMAIQRYELKASLGEFNDKEDNAIKEAKVKSDQIIQEARKSIRNLEGLEQSKISHIKKLILDTDKAINDYAIKVGFDIIVAPSTIFKR